MVTDFSKFTTDAMFELLTEPTLSALQMAFVMCACGAFGFAVGRITGGRDG